MIKRILDNQAKLNQTRLWITTGLVISLITFYFSLPEANLLAGVMIASIIFTVFVILMAFVDGIKQYLLWIPPFTILHFINKYTANEPIDTIQLSAMTILGMASFTVLVLRFCRFINLKRNHPRHLDQSIIPSLLFPSYSRGYGGNTLAHEAIRNILQIRKGHHEAANYFSKLAFNIRNRDTTNRLLTLSRLREIATSSNLNISKREFDHLFDYYPNSVTNRILNKLINNHTADRSTEKLKKGDRVIYPYRKIWGVGEILVYGDRVAWIYFADSGLKTLGLEHVNLVRVSGKKSEHPNLVNLNFSKAELGIEEYFGFEKYVEKHSRPALLLSKTYNSTDSLTYFGGKPIAPKGFKWPKSDVYGKQQCMQFLAQIDLRDPHLANFEGMPTGGILYFFLDENVYEGDDSTTQSVFYINDHLEEMQPVEPLGEPSSIIGRESYYGEQTYTYSGDSSHTIFPARLFPKFEVCTEPFNDIRSPYSVYCHYMFEIGRENYDDLNKSVREQEASNLLHALSKIHGEESAQKRFSDMEFRSARLMDPDVITKDIIISDREPGVSPLFERWPQSWLHVGLWLSKARYFCPTRGYFAALPDVPLKKKFLEGCEKMVLKAKQKGPFTPLTENERRSIIKWSSDIFLKSLEVWHSKDNKDKAERDVAYKIWNFLLYEVEGSALEATSRCLDLEQSNRALLNTAEKDDFLRWFEGLAPNSTFHRHQMFGYGVNVQNAAEENIDKVLLLQLYTDGPMSWMFADVGAVQYWISKDDLKNRRFDKVTVTMEGG
ncbi:DUF1963 domain-containing protein [Hahella ganghwensis]|uniref:DUF1963 domain-containing protein n=1 Tax=Hahella ganghwensis TaxID=286420 RepID=UPI0003809B5F|nr:DUF1963 domain-containing protein [Hahella ganghwensis]